jgi:hypothetical protein
VGQQKATFLIADLSKWEGFIMAFEFRWKKDSPDKLLAERFQTTAGFPGGQCDIIGQHVQ